MILSFHPCFDAHVQIILGDRSLASDDLKLIHGADAIILPQGCPEELHKACAESRAFVFPNYDMRFRYPGKMKQSLLFEDFGFPYPETRCWLNIKEFKKAYAQPGRFPHELPFLIKDNMSHEGDGVFLVRDHPSLATALDHLDRRERSGLPGFVTQALVPCGGNALRAVIIGKRIITYWKRPTSQGQIITTISRDAIVDHDWAPSLQEKGKKQAQDLSQLTGINLAAIDFVFPGSLKEADPLFLEINYYFGRRGLGGTQIFYGLLYHAIQDWLIEAGLNPESVRLI